MIVQLLKRASHTSRNVVTWKGHVLPTNAERICTVWIIEDVLIVLRNVYPVDNHPLQFSWTSDSVFVFVENDATFS